MSTHPEWCIHHTDGQLGYRMFLSPPQGDLEYLHYGRIRLAPAHPRETLVTGPLEMGLLCVAGTARIGIDGRHFQLGRCDLLYVPSGHEVRLESEESCDFIAAAAPSSVESVPVHLRWSEVKDDPARAMEAGEAEKKTRRRIYNLITPDIHAERLLMGITIGDPSGWTSWPPHEHADTKEEVYAFFDMPAPAFAVQFVYTDPAKLPEKMEVCEVVRDGSAIAVPRGYHPNAAEPGFTCTFVWMMAARNPATDRDWARGIHVQQDYAGYRFV